MHILLCLAARSQLCTVSPADTRTPSIFRLISSCRFQDLILKNQQIAKTLPLLLLPDMVKTKMYRSQLQLTGSNFLTTKWILDPKLLQILSCLSIRNYFACMRMPIFSEGSMIFIQQLGLSGSIHTSELNDSQDCSLSLRWLS